MNKRYTINKNLFYKFYRMSISLLILCSLTAIFYFPLLKYWGTNFHLEIDRFGDNGPFKIIIEAIRTGNFENANNVVIYWGYPLFSYIFGNLFFLHDNISMIIVNFIAFILLFLILKNLYNEIVAILFNIYSIDWIQRIYLGGSEPLFLLFLFLSLYIYRKNKNFYLIGILLGISYTIRPVGVFLLGAFILDAFFKKEFKDILVVLLTFTLIIVIYHLYVGIMMNDPFLNFNNYQKKDWDTVSPISFPFFAIFKSFQGLDSGFLNKLKLGFYFLISFIPFLILIKNRRKSKYLFNDYRIEMIFFLSYFLFLISYNTTYWIALIFPRIYLPIAPIAIFISINSEWKISLLIKILFLIMSFITVFIASLSAVGFQNILK